VLLNRGVKKEVKVASRGRVRGQGSRSRSRRTQPGAGAGAGVGAAFQAQVVSGGTSGGPGISGVWWSGSCRSRRGAGAAPAPALPGRHFRPAAWVGGWGAAAPGAGDRAGIRYGGQGVPGPTNNRGRGRGRRGARGGQQARQWRVAVQWQWQKQHHRHQPATRQDSRLARGRTGTRQEAAHFVLCIICHAACHMPPLSWQCPPRVSGLGLISHQPSCFLLITCFLWLVASSLASRSYPFLLNPALYRTRYHRSMQ
jgi:hypothetical protein